jgi:hypothetical protein
MAAFRSVGKMDWRKASAALLCLALLYFAGGGSYLHKHNGGPDNTCHVCHSLHAPALTASFSGIASAPQISGWHDLHRVVVGARDEVSQLRSGRAPPSA